MNGLRLHRNADGLIAGRESIAVVEHRDFRCEPGAHSEPVHFTVPMVVRSIALDEAPGHGALDPLDAFMLTIDGRFYCDIRQGILVRRPFVFEPRLLLSHFYVHFVTVAPAPFTLSFYGARERDVL